MSSHALKPVESGSISRESATSGVSHEAYDGLSVRLTPAPFLTRFLGMCIDLGAVSTLIQLGLIACCLTLAILMGGAFAALKAVADSGPLSPAVKSIPILLYVVMGLMGLALLSIYHAYFIWYEYKRGMTPGKKMMGMKVVSLVGPRLTLGQCVQRQVFRDVDFLLLFSGPLAFILTEKRQKLGDLVAGTMVVHSKFAEQADSYLYLPQEDYLLLADSHPKASVPLATAREFLKLAYPVFILGTQIPTREGAEKWARIASENLGQSSSGAELDQRSLLQFFAEFCLQTVNKHEKGKSP
jgi:uncharacterized RDD family membrane protein YckC